jgi:hypothetical protein
MEAGLNKFSAESAMQHSPRRKPWDWAWAEMSPAMRATQIGHALLLLCPCSAFVFLFQPRASAALQPPRWADFLSPTSICTRREMGHGM